MRLRKLRQLIEAARRTRTMDFEWTAETCYWLQRGEGVDEEARGEVARIVEEVEEDFRRRVEQWRAVGFDYEGEVWPMYEKLLEAVELLAQRPDRIAAQRLCDVLKAINVELEEVAIRHLLGQFPFSPSLFLFLAYGGFPALSSRRSFPPFLLSVYRQLYTNSPIGLYWAELCRLVTFGLRSRVFLPMAPIYLNVTPTWLIEVRSRSEEELLRLKWHGLLGTRAFGITKKELVQCIKDDLCLEALLRSICAAVRTGYVRAKKAYLKSWLTFCIRYWQT